MLYQILQQTPFSIQYFPRNSYRPIAEFQLQMAEYDLGLNKNHYYEHAIISNGCFFYPLEIAERIVLYWKKKYSFAKYKLKFVEKIYKCPKCLTEWRTLKGDSDESIVRCMKCCKRFPIGPNLVGVP